MSIFAISDLHLSFGEGVDKPMDIYGGPWIGHAEQIRNNWLASVTAEDTVLICGDISWGLRLNEALADLAWIHELPGRKIAIRGNHDLWWNGISRINRLHDDILFLQNTHTEAEGWAICGSRGWLCPGDDDFTADDRKIYERELLRMEMSLSSARESGAEKIIAMIHYPPVDDKRRPSGFTELFEKYSVDTVLYGHIHGQDKVKHCLNGSFNGVEYRLTSTDFLLNKPLKIKD